MKKLIRKAFDVEAFNKIKLRIDSEDITLSETKTLKLKIKNIEREYDHPLSGISAILFFIFFGIVIIPYIVLDMFSINFFSVLFITVIYIILIICIYIAMNNIKNFYIYKNNYHKDYMEAVEKLNKIQAELDTKDHAERFELDIFLQNRGQDIYNYLKVYIQKEDVEEHIKKRLLKTFANEFLQKIDHTGNVIP